MEGSFLFIYILCTLMFCLHACLCEGVGSPGTGIVTVVRYPGECWELNPGLLEKQPVLKPLSHVSMTNYL